MSDLSPEARALVEAGRAERASAASKAAIKSNVLAQVGAAAATSAPAAGLGLGFKGMGAVLGLGLVAGALYVARPAAEPTPTPTPTSERIEVAVADEAAAPAAVELPPVVETEPDGAPAAPAAETPPAAKPKPKLRRSAAQKPAVEATPVEVEAPTVDPLRLAREARLLKSIRVALRDADYPRVLELTAEHAASFPDGMLVTERLAARALALCGQGDRAAGLAARAEVVAAAPTSVHLERIDAACAD